MEQQKNPEHVIDHIKKERKEQSRAEQTENAITVGMYKENDWKNSVVRKKKRDYSNELLSQAKSLDLILHFLAAME